MDDQKSLLDLFDTTWVVTKRRNSSENLVLWTSFTLETGSTFNHYAIYAWRLTFEGIITGRR